jgi:hypothetical protein
MKSTNIIDFAPYKAKQLVVTFENNNKIDLGKGILKDQDKLFDYLNWLDTATDRKYQQSLMKMMTFYNKKNSQIKDSSDVLTHVGFFKYNFNSSIIPENVFDGNQMLFLFSELHKLVNKDIDKLDTMDYDYINLVYDHRESLSSILKSCVHELGNNIYKWKNINSPDVMEIVDIVGEARNYLLHCGNLMKIVLEMRQEIIQ